MNFQDEMKKKRDEWLNASDSDNAGKRLWFAYGADWAHDFLKKEISELKVIIRDLSLVESKNKKLEAENARYREALEFYANDSWDLGCGCCQDIHSEVFIKRSEVADKALKGGEK